MSDAYLGEIRMFAGNFAPRGWALCDGSQLLIKSNEALYTLIGTIYGGDGRTTFKLPDYRGRTPVGQGGGSGLANWVVGETAGVEQITLTALHTPPHIHGFQVSTTDVTSPTPQPAGQPANTQGFGKFKLEGSFTGLYSKGEGSPAVVSLSPNFLSTALGSPGKAVEPHNNMMGSLAINYIICLTGTYPQQA
ncbi:phage tail protein [Pseudomonas piscis]|uniref:phage tail protein n=1 Tax=Pseudomonas piscis TaxID=2614538 RepID=UPI0021D5F095|nr:tail fiber protein [Pseudomonas piscis]MCU7647181.1 tail fiber protein [Pseudomonas piscis]